jgi:ribosomal protein L37E
MADTTYFEVRCERCKTSFAPGTKQCIHCGGPIGRRLLAFDALSARRTGAPVSSDTETPEADEQPKMGRIVQLAMFAIVVVAAVVRSCAND